MLAKICSFVFRIINIGFTHWNQCTKLSNVSVSDSYIQDVNEVASVLWTTWFVSTRIFKVYMLQLLFYKTFLTSLYLRKWFEKKPDIIQRTYKLEWNSFKPLAQINQENDRRESIVQLTWYGEGLILSPNTTWPRFSTGESDSSTVQKSNLKYDSKYQL